MIKKSLAILSISAAFFAQAQDVSTVRNAYDVYGSPLNGTSRYNAMAGANGALGGDISSLNNNPAGLGVAITSDISGTLLVQANKNSSQIFGNSTDYTSKSADVGQLGGIASFELNGKTPWRFVNIGVNFSNKSVDDYVESSGNNSIAIAAGNDALGFDAHAYDRTGTISKMGIGVGGNYDNRFYLGTGINVHSAHIEQSDFAQMTYASDQVSDIFYKQYTPYGEDASGFSASLGVIGKINNQFRLGAAIETPTFWTIDRTYSYYDSQDSSYDDVYSENRKFQSPLKATVSAAFVPTKNLALNVDYSIGLTKPKFKTGDAELESELNDFYSGYKNQSEVKVGAEYRINGFRLRGGYAFANSPFDSYSVNTMAANNSAATQTYSNMFAGNRNTFGIGLGYDFKSFYIDAAYHNVSSTYSSPFLTGNASYGSQYFSSDYSFENDASLVSTVKNTQNNVSLTLGWKF